MRFLKFITTCVSICFLYACSDKPADKSDDSLHPSFSELPEIIEESDQEQMIMKPLDGFGGRGVIIIEKSASKNIKSLLDFYVNNSRPGEKSQYVILQEYVAGAEKGDGEYGQYFYEIS